MLDPQEVNVQARKKEKENMKFRTFLKNHADEDTLDKQFLELHQKLFDGYDCSQCRNCCKMYSGSIPGEDIGRDAAYLHMTEEAFIKRYLCRNSITGAYETIHNPCDFLQENGECLLGECKPENCVKYPYTDQPERLWSLYSVLEAVKVCPVAFEIYEQLKEEYGFRRNR